MDNMIYVENLQGAGDQRLCQSLVQAEEGDCQGGGRYLVRGAEGGDPRIHWTERRGKKHSHQNADGYSRADLGNMPD